MERAEVKAVAAVFVQGQAHEITFHACKKNSGILYSTTVNACHRQTSVVAR
jgi:hypothetical protein